MAVPWMASQFKAARTAKPTTDNDSGAVVRGWRRGVGGWRQQQTGITYCLIHDEFSRYYKAFHIPANEATRRLTSSRPPPSFPSGPAYPPQCNFCGSSFCSADNQLTKHIRLTLSVLCLCGRDCLLHNGDPDSVSDNFQHMIYRNKYKANTLDYIPSGNRLWFVKVADLIPRNPGEYFNWIARKGWKRDPLIDLLLTTV